MGNCPHRLEQSSPHPSVGLEAVQGDDLALAARSEVRDYPEALTSSFSHEARKVARVIGTRETDDGKTPLLHDLEAPLMVSEVKWPDVHWE